MSSMPSSSSTPAPVQLHGQVERRLAAQRRQQRVGPLAAQHAGDALEVERLDVRPVGPAGVGHDRGRVGVDEDRLVALLAQHAQAPARRSSRTRRPGRSRSGPEPITAILCRSSRRGTSAAPPRARRPTRSTKSHQRVAGVVRPGRGLGVELHRPDRPVGQPQALDRAVVERRVRDLDRPPRPSGTATAKPWFCDVTSTRPVPASSTGWLAPRWPKRSLNVSRPERAGQQLVAEADAEQRPVELQHRRGCGRRASSMAPGSPGPLASRMPSGSMARTSSAVASCGSTVDVRRPASARSRAMESLAP